MSFSLSRDDRYLQEPEGHDGKKIKRPPVPAKILHHSSISRGPQLQKFNLTKEQQVQVAIIDWKRRAVRWLLVISYVTLLHFLAYLFILGQSYSLIHESPLYTWAFYGFFMDLMLYFYGSGVALKAISYVWRPIRYFVGVLLIALAAGLNVFLFFVGNHSTDLYENGFPRRLTQACHNTTSDSEHGDENPNKIICDGREIAKLGLIILPLILPPVTLICLIISVFSAYNAIYRIPKRLLPEITVDAVWLEPYETYDFYVGRNIPRIPGYDEVFEDNTPPPILLHLSSQNDNNGPEPLKSAMKRTGKTGGNKRRSAPTSRISAKVAQLETDNIAKNPRFSGDSSQPPKKSI